LAGEMNERRLIQEAGSVEVVSQELQQRLEASDAFLLNVYMTGVVVLIITGIFYLIWLFRAVKALHALEVHDFPYDAGWCVGWFFIPFANLVRPCQVHLQLSRASYPATHVHWKQNPSLVVVGVWWACWIASYVAARFSMAPLRVPDPTIDDYLRSNTGAMLESVFNIIAAVAAIIMLRQIMHRQSERANLIASKPPVATA
jgi:hypothetical protein